MRDDVPVVIHIADSIFTAVFSKLIGADKFVQHEEEGVFVRDLEGGIAFNEFPADFLKIIHVLAEYGRNSAAGRFQRVVSALGNEAAADEGNVTGAIQFSEITDRVDQQDIFQQLRTL